VRENRTHGSEGGEDGVLLYPYRGYSASDLSTRSVVKSW